MDVSAMPGATASVAALSIGKPAVFVDYEQVLYLGAGGDAGGPFFLCARGEAINAEGAPRYLSRPVELMRLASMMTGMIPRGLIQRASRPPERDC